MERIPIEKAAPKGTSEILNGEVLVTEETASKMTKPEISELNGDTTAQVPAETIRCDVIVVGAGFCGITSIHRFRKLGLKVKCFESGSDFGGVWYWNRYPGARVDSECPLYQLNIPEVYRRWHFNERFSDHVELRRYVAHIDKTLNLRKDVYFNARVVDATWDSETRLWNIKTQQGHKAQAKYLMCASGLLHRTYTPDFPGLKRYKGEIYHSAAWPEDFDGKGKKIGIIGAGATAVQITQELGKEASELTVFLRRPSQCLPMGQRKWTEEEQRSLKAFYPALFKAGRDSWGGMPTTGPPVGALDVSEEEREAYLEELWARGGFNFLAANYSNMLTDKDANRVIYDFWRRKVCERLTDPEKQKIMAPETPNYYLCTKRPPLEQDYYEVLDQPNVFLHDMSKVPLKSFHEKGLVMADDTLYELDAIALATGFDSYTGSLTHMGLKNKDGIDLKELWRGGISTYLGITISGFPNMFMAYTPQSPVPLSNGPTIIEAQVETIADMIAKLESENAKTIEPQEAAAEEWKQSIETMAQYTLIPFTDSWWNDDLAETHANVYLCIESGANIPGKKAQSLIHVGGISMYEKQVRATMDGWKGFEVVTAA